MRKKEIITSIVHLFEKRNNPTEVQIQKNTRALLEEHLLEGNIQLGKEREIPLDDFHRRLANIHDHVRNRQARGEERSTRPTVFPLDFLENVLEGSCRLDKEDVLQYESSAQVMGYIADFFHKKHKKGVNREGINTLRVNVLRILEHNRTGNTVHVRISKGIQSMFLWKLYLLLQKKHEKQNGESLSVEALRGSLPPREQIEHLLQQTETLQKK